MGRRRASRAHDEWIRWVEAKSPNICNGDWSASRVRDIYYCERLAPKGRIADDFHVRLNPNLDMGSITEVADI